MKKILMTTLAMVVAGTSAYAADETTVDCRYPLPNGKFSRVVVSVKDGVAEYKSNGSWEKVIETSTISVANVKNDEILQYVVESSDLPLEGVKEFTRFVLSESDDGAFALYQLEMNDGEKLPLFLNAGMAGPIPCIPKE